MASLYDRLIAAANGDESWRGRLFREAAQGMSAGTAETPEAAQGDSPPARSATPMRPDKPTPTQEHQQP